MAEEKQSLQICESPLFVKIFQTFRMAVQPGKLIIALGAIAAIVLAGWLMDFSRTVVVAESGVGKATELDIYMADASRLSAFVQTHGEDGLRTGVFSTLWHFNTARFHNALSCLFSFNLPGVAANAGECVQAACWAARYHLLYCIVFFALKLAVIAAAGGSICRLAAMQFAQGEKPGLAEAIRFGCRRFASLFTAPLAPFGIVVFIGLFVFLLGLVANIPRVGELVMGICLPLALIAGALIGLVLIGTAAGFNLMFPAVAYDGSDCFDAISRSFSYVYSKPWRMGFYSAVAVVYGAICYVFVRFFALLMLWSAYLGLQAGVFTDGAKQTDKLAAIWPKPTFLNLLGADPAAAGNWTEHTAAFLVYLLVLAVIGLLVAFVISFYFSANTIIYALMRNRVDNTSIEDVHTEAVEEPPAEAEKEQAKKKGKEPAGGETEKKPREQARKKGKEPAGGETEKEPQDQAEDDAGK
jgi:hypothetical protein